MKNKNKTRQDALSMQISTLKNKANDKRSDPMEAEKVGIFVGGDVLEHAGTLEEIDYTYSTDLNVATSDNIITERISFFKEHKRTD